ncbi:MAG: lipopolysaccharide biosynthesis protein, partial [Gammaproteobacteria bacterium]|nr:lipopolysaccharide biosynthesis protein [Gammaproteobacteria bacterium]
VVIALVWPPTYKSAATILIKEQEIPTELVRSTVTSYAAQRIQTISQRVMTRNNLMQIVEKYNLYVKDRKRKTTEEVLEEMRDDIGLNMISADVMDPRTGRPGVATIAFTLSYLGDSPGSTQKVAGELTSLFLAENLKTRKEKASETYIFLTDETDKLASNITEIENKLADFKDKHADSLPEMATMNLTMMNRVENDLTQVEAELRSKQERKFYLESQLAQINPLTNMRSATGVSILDPVSRLKALESEYASITAKYSEQHPDVIKIKREIAGLRQQTGAAVDVAEMAKQLSSKRSELAVVKKKYAADHPDVIKLQNTVNKLEQEVQRADKMPEKKVMEIQPENPAYISVQTQLKTAESDMESIREHRAQLKEKLLDLEERIAKSPQVEKEYQVLKREHANALARFQDIKARQMEAEIGQELEKESKGESFVLIDPAQYPEQPVKPNRIAIVFLSLIFAIASGFGLAILQEGLDSSVRGVSGVSKMLTAAPLAVIPVIYNSQDLIRKQRITRVVVGSTIVGVVAVFLLVHFFWTPLDVLWFRGIRKAENVIGV